MTIGSEMLLEEPIADITSPARPTTFWQRVDDARSSDAGRGAIALIDQAIFSGTTFATSLIIKHMSSQAELGLYYLALTIVMLVRNIEEQLIAVPYRVYGHRDRPNELASYTASVFVHQLCLSAIGMLAMPVCLEMFVHVGILTNNLPSPVIVCVMLAMPFFLSRESVRFITFCKVKVVTALVFDLVVCAVQLAALVTLGYMHQLTVVSAFLAIGTSCGLATFGWLVLERSELRFNPSRFWPDWQRNWVLSKWALLATIAGVIYPLIAPWVLRRSHEEAVGLFAASLSLAGLPQMFIMGVSNWAAPQAARAFTHGGVKEMSKVLVGTLLIFMVVIGGFAATAFVAGDWIMTKIWGADLAGSGTVFAILAASMVAHSLSNVAANGLWAMELPHAHYKADWSMLVTTVILALILVGPLGPVGAAWASFAGAVVGAAVRAFSLWWNMFEIKVATLGGRS